MTHYLAGVYGGPGYFNKPRICHGDSEGSLLVADKKNQCLQVSPSLES